MSKQEINEHIEMTQSSVLEDTLKEIISHYGIESQIKKSIEEMDGLKEAITSDDTPWHIAEEIADVSIMLRQLMLIFGVEIDDVAAIAEYKIARTLNRMEEPVDSEEPTENVKDIIHCRDCEHYFCHADKVSWFCSFWGSNRRVNAEAFCSFGQKRDEEAQKHDQV